MLSLWCLFCCCCVVVCDGDYRISWWFLSGPAGGGIGDKTYVRDSFYFVCIAILAAAILTIKTTQGHERQRSKERRQSRQNMQSTHTHTHAKTQRDTEKFLVPALSVTCCLLSVVCCLW